MGTIGARRLWLLWIAVVPVALWASARLLGVDGGYPLAPMMVFTPYAAVAALFVAGVAVAAENWAAAAVAALATLALATAVLPRAIGQEAVAVDGHRTFSILAANVYRGQADPAALVALVDRLHPDVLSVEELTTPFARGLAAAGLPARMPYTQAESDLGAAGSGLFSRLPLLELPDSHPLGSQMSRAMVQLPGGQRVRVLGVHPFPPQGPTSTREWEGALSSLPSGGRGAPWVLAGDFNATLDQSQLRDVVDRGYRDAGATAGEGLEPTFPRADHTIPPVTIDHVLADRRLGVVSYAVEELAGSDHRAVFARLRLP